MICSVNHQTVFDFEPPPVSVVQRLHLAPLERKYQKVVDWEILVEGGTLDLEADDYHGNRVHLCHHALESPTIKITSRGKVDVKDNNGIFGEHDNRLPLPLFTHPTPLTAPGPLVRRLGNEMEKFRGAGDPGDVEILHELSSRILKRVRYSKGKTDTSTSAEQAMKLGVGVCQDHVHAFLAVTRLLGYPSRYVSGYLLMEGNAVQEASHAWAEVHVEALGWVGFDISNIISPDDRYIKVATGFDYQDVVPISGVKFGSGEERLTTSITVSQQ